MGAVVANSRSDVALLKFGYDFHEAPLVGAFVISADDFSASRNANGVPTVVLKFAAAVKFWRRVFITDMFKKKRPKFVELVCKMCQKAYSQCEVFTLEATNAEWLSAQKKGEIRTSCRVGACQREVGNTC